MVARSAIRSATSAAIAPVELRDLGAGATSSSGSADSHHPAIWLTWMLFSPNVRGMFGFDLEEDGDLAEEPRDVVRVGPEREEAVPVRRGRPGDQQRAPGGAPEQPGHVREVGGHELAAAFGVRRPARCG